MQPHAWTAALEHLEGVFVEVRVEQTVARRARFGVGARGWGERGSGGFHSFHQEGGQVHEANARDDPREVRWVDERLPELGGVSSHESPDLPDNL
jgi:hypothetical protein